MNTTTPETTGISRPVCAHMNFGSATGYAVDQSHFPNHYSAIKYFQHACTTVGARYNDADDTAVLDLYFDAADCGCDSSMCFHDYPHRRYQLGPRGGISIVSGI